MEIYADAITPIDVIINKPHESTDVHKRQYFLWSVAQLS